MFLCNNPSMNFKALIIAPLILLFALNFVFAAEDAGTESGRTHTQTGNAFTDSITEKEIDAFLRTEYNRSATFYGELSLMGGMEFFDQLKVKGGISLGRTERQTDINTFVRANYMPFSFPLGFTLAWIYNGIPEYEADMHTILPYISFGNSRAGISVGMNFRFSSHFGEEAQFESILSFSGYLNFLDTESLQVGISAGNFTDFYAKNMGAFSLKLHAIVNLDNNWTIINEIEILQSGADGLATNFYGFAWRGGARYKW